MIRQTTLFKYIKPLVKIKDCRGWLGVSSSGELRINNKQLNTLFRGFMQLNSYF